MKRLFQPFLAWILTAPRPQPNGAPSGLLAVTIETEAAGYLHTQLRLNIRQKERIQAFVPFRLRDLVELKGLIPNQKSLVFLTPWQLDLLEAYVIFYWQRAKDAEEAGKSSAYDMLRDEVFFVKRNHLLIA